jgi:hypothetical protein
VKTPLQAAQDLDRCGFNVVPAPHKTKNPVIKWRAYQTERTTKMLPVWFEGKTPRNYVVICGRVSGGLIVLDTDSDAAHERWYSKIGDAMDATCCVQTGKGRHYYFRMPDDDRRYGGRQRHQGDDHWDLRGEGNLVPAPPSVHASGRVYEWIRSPEEYEILEAPQFLLNVSVGGTFESGDAVAGEVTSGSGVVRSMLSHLLTHPGEGGRNNWVTQVLGHYAKQHARMQDLYLAEAERVWGTVADLPASDGSGEVYARAEFDKTLRSVWEAEMRKGVSEEAAKRIDGDCGWLVAGDYRIHTQVRYKGEEKAGWRYGFEPWGDFDLVALGVVEDDDAQRVYDVEIRRARKRDVRRGLLPASVLNTNEKLAGWLAEYGCGFFPPDNQWPKKGTQAERLRCYLEAQNPPHFEVVDALGWYEGSDGFVCFEGVIRADGLHGFEMHKPHPRLSKGWAPYRYGFDGDWGQAQEILREVLTFHDETVCSVFGAWWAACLLKPQITEAVSQFPFMALEAPSESGKTTGFFGMLLALGGNSLGNTNPTAASLRDYLSGNQSGIFWIDDLNDVSHLMELLRQATGDGAVAKKAEDKVSQAQIRLVNPICLSGEALPIRTQKALVDRAVLLDVPSPTSRRSLRNLEALQWVDLVALRQAHPDLTRYAGWYVAAALGLRDLVGDLPGLVPDGTAGRYGDKIAVLRLGARLLARLTGDEIHVARVDEWTAQQVDSGSENTLTLKAIPAALLHFDHPSIPSPSGDSGRGVPTPVFVEPDGTVWFSPQHLALWIEQRQHGRIEIRTETVDALIQQAKALGLGGTAGVWRKQWKLRGTSIKAVYWRLSDVLSRLVVDRALGGALEPAQEGLFDGAGEPDSGLSPPSRPGPSKGVARTGVHPEQHRLDLGLDLAMGPQPHEDGV